jgi:hypothetical protein
VALTLRSRKKRKSALTLPPVKGRVAEGAGWQLGIFNPAIAVDLEYSNPRLVHLLDGT